MCTIEHSTWNHLGWVVFVPGMFNFKMACTDTLWHIHIEPKAGQTDPMGFFEYIWHLWTRETGKFNSSPGFHQMHVAIHNAIWADILDCWCIATHEQDFTSLEDLPGQNLNGMSFAESLIWWWPNTYQATTSKTIGRGLTQNAISGLKTNHC